MQSIYFIIQNVHGVRTLKDYWLAKLISSVDKVDSRKRLQKAVFLLQTAGSPLKCDYILHYYGPYSFELANLVDKLKSSKIIEEKPEQRYSAVSYTSKLTDIGIEVLQSFEKSENGKKYSDKISPFTKQFVDLMKEKTWILELAATIAFFHNSTWQEAKKQTASFKKVGTNDQDLEQALKIARKYKKSA